MDRALVEARTRPPLSGGKESRLLSGLEKIDLAPFDPSVHRREFGNDGRYEFDGIVRSLPAALTADTIEHSRIQRTETELRIAHLGPPQYGPQTRQFRRQPRVKFPIMRSHRQLHELQMQIVQIRNQMKRMIQVSLPFLTLLPQKIGDIHVPLQIEPLLRLGESARLYQLGMYRFRAELQRPQQVLQLPEIQNIFGDILPPLRFGDVHMLYVLSTADTTSTRFHRITMSRAALQTSGTPDSDRRPISKSKRPTANRTPEITEQSVPQR